MLYYIVLYSNAISIKRECFLASGECRWALDWFNTKIYRIGHHHRWWPTSVLWPPDNFYSNAISILCMLRKMGSDIGQVPLSSSRDRNVWAITSKCQWKRNALPCVARLKYFMRSVSLPYVTQRKLNVHAFSVCLVPSQLPLTFDDNEWVSIMSVILSVLRPVHSDVGTGAVKLYVMPRHDGVYTACMT